MMPHAQLNVNTNLTCLSNIKAVNYGHHAELNDDRSHYNFSMLCFG